MVNIIGTNENDTLQGTSDEDILTGLDGNDLLIGLENIDLLLGGSGEDTLDGSQGGDLFYGGAGNDIYLVDNFLDLVSEKSITSEEELLSIETLEQLQSIPDAGGIDSIISTTDYILPTDVSINGTLENLTLEGTTNLVGTGNNLDNVIQGNSGINTLSGANGNDTLIGNAGDDVLSGNVGADSFVYVSDSTFADANFGLDTILDFTKGEDLIVLSANTFGLSNTNSAGLSSQDFAIVNSDNEIDISDAVIVFHSERSTLFFNPNRSEPGFGVEPSIVAFLTVVNSTDPNPAITELNPATDFVVVADDQEDNINNNDGENLAVYRFFNNDTGVHFYTANGAEREVIENELPNFSFEGASYLSVDPLTGEPTPSPVYRFLNQDTGVHLYTISETEKDFVENELPNFSSEGEAFYAYPTQEAGTIPIYRFFNSTSGAHFYTPSAQERDFVENELPSFQFEEIAYYAFPAAEIN